MFRAQSQMAGGPQKTCLAFCRTAFTTPPSRLPTDGLWLRSHIEKADWSRPGPCSCFMKPLHGCGAVWGDALPRPQQPNSLWPPSCLGTKQKLRGVAEGQRGDRHTPAVGCHQCSWSHAVPSGSLSPGPASPVLWDLTYIPPGCVWLGRWAEKLGCNGATAGPGR